MTHSPQKRTDDTNGAGVRKPTKKELVKAVADLGALGGSMISCYRNDLNPKRACDMEIIAKKIDALTQDIINQFPAKWMQ